jgi:SHS2 domain-containing protein
MAKSHQMIDHGGDVGIEAHADSREELLEALAEGVAEVICPPSAVRPRETRKLSVQAEDIEAATVDFLNALLRLIQVEHFLVAAVKARVSRNALAAEVAGEPYDPARHELAREVKAVTYHELKVARQGERWYGRVVCDL